MKPGGIPPGGASVRGAGNPGESSASMRPGGPTPPPGSPAKAGKRRPGPREPVYPRGGGKPDPVESRPAGKRLARQPDLAFRRPRFHEARPPDGRRLSPGASPGRRRARGPRARRPCRRPGPGRPPRSNRSTRPHRRRTRCRSPGPGWRSRSGCRRTSTRSRPTRRSSLRPGSPPTRRRACRARSRPRTFATRGRPRKALRIPCTVAFANPAARSTWVSPESQSSPPRGAGKTRSLPSPMAWASSMIARAGPDRGTTCSTPAFMRSPGMVKVFASRSTSLHVAPRISPDRQAVRITSCKARLATGRLSSLRTAARASPTFACARAVKWPRCFPLRGRAARTAGVGSSLR